MVNSRSLCHCLKHVLAKPQSLSICMSSVFCLLAVTHYAWVNAGLVSALWGPRIVCEPSKFDCGEVPAVGTIECEFTVRNSGRMPLHINAEAGCGSCSTVKLSKVEILPGDISLLKVLLDASRLKKGTFKKQVLVRTDDPRSPKVILYLYGKAT